MRRLIALATLVCIVLLAASSVAAQKRDFTACGSKDPDTRISVCTRAIASGLFRGKNLAVSYNNRGWGYYDKKDFDRAITDLNEAIRLDPGLALAYVNRGSAFQAKGEYDRAISDFSELIRLAKSADNYFRRGSIYALRNDFDRALADFDEAIRMNSKHALSYAGRGYAYVGKRNYDRALQEYNEILRLDPKDVSANAQRGQVLHEKGDYDRAVADYSEAIRLDPKNWMVFHLRGRSYREKRDFDRAVSDFNEANRLDPKNALPVFGRSLALEKKGDLSAAYRDVVEALALDPSNAEGQQSRDRLRSALVGSAQPSASAQTAATAVDKAPLIKPQPAPPAAAAIAGPRVALVIGNGRYQHATVLNNPANDAADISASLRRLGFEVVEGRDLDKRAMEDKVREFGRKLDGAKLALFFYAGHGLQVSGRNYLIAIDSKLERQGDLSFETIDVNQVLAQMEAEQRVNLVFLDACRDNPLTRSLARALGTRSTSVGQGLASIQSAVGTMIAYATQPDALALDGSGRNSPFTAALLKHLDTKGLEIGSMMRRVRAEVVQATNGKQVPWDHSSLLGDVVLAQ